MVDISTVEVDDLVALVVNTVWPPMGMESPRWLGMWLVVRRIGRTIHIVNLVSDEVLVVDVGQVGLIYGFAIRQF